MWPKSIHQMLQRIIQFDRPFPLKLDHKAETLATKFFDNTKQEFYRSQHDKTFPCPIQTHGIQTIKSNMFQASNKNCNLRN